MIDKALERRKLPDENHPFYEECSKIAKLTGIFQICPEDDSRKAKTKTTAPAHQKQSHEYSPATQVIAQRMADGGVDHLKQNLIHIMIASAKLAEEAEFRDLYLDGKKAAQVTEHS